MRRFLSFLAALTALAPASVDAQRPANLSTRSDISDQERARDTMDRFAACVVKARPNLSKEALFKRSVAESYAALAALVKPECLAGGMLRMDPHIFHGAVSRALYLREFGAHAEPLHFSAGNIAPATQGFAPCVLRAAPAATPTFVVADVGSPEERQALSDLGPALASCVNPREQIGFTPAALEALLADALYQSAVSDSQNPNPVSDE
jgi:hypothetical protein